MNRVTVSIPDEIYCPLCSLSRSSGLTIVLLIRVIVVNYIYDQMGES